MNKKVKNDIILVAVMLVVAAAGFVIFSLTAKTGDVAVVSVDGITVERLPLDQNCEKRIESGSGGYNVVVIRDGVATVSDASCPDHICVNHRPVSNESETIVCLPNKLVVEIVGE